MKRSGWSWRCSAFLLLALLCALPHPSVAQLVREEKAAVRLVAGATAYEPGERVELAAVVTIEDGWHVNSHTPSYDYLIPTELQLTLPEGSSEPEVVYPQQKMLKFAFTEEPIAVYDGKLVIRASFELPKSLAAGKLTIDGGLRYQACDDNSCLPPVTTEASFELTIGPGGKPANREVFGAVAPPAPAAPAGGAGLAGKLLLALLGGLILNAMPCVLPVLSLKVFGLVKSAGQGRAQVVTAALATAGGIVVSFLALALAAVVARAAGAAVGWGIQFQQPGFVAFLAVVVVLFSLNLWGLFEIPLPQSLARAAGTGPREGLAGHFGSGLFATLMATPCSAPFLGTAVGFALAQTAPVIFAIFAAVGVGMALPYLLLAAAPGLARFLPKPGDWMLTLRGVMGFLLAGAAVWLFYVLAGQISTERLALIQLTVLILALFIWLWQRAPHGSGWRKLDALGGLAAAVATIFLAADAPLRATATSIEEGPISWVAFDETEAHTLAAEGRLVFVDVTADWCLTCKTNERLVLASDEVVAAFERHGVIPMKADWTNRNDTIAAYLARFGRSSIPFYVLYRPSQEPHVFSELLTRGAVLDALASSGELAAKR